MAGSKRGPVLGDAGASISRRSVLGGIAGTGFLLATGLGGVSAQTSSIIATENQRPGSRGYLLTQPAAGSPLPLAAYCRASSASVGERIAVCVRSSRNTTVQIQIYRIGYYGGLGGRLVATLGPTPVATAPPATVDSITGLTITGAPVAAEPLIGSDWVSGFYVAKVIDHEGYECVATFIVKDNRSSDLLYQHPNLTYAAYTAGTDGVGKGFYDQNSGSTLTVSGKPRAVQISLDRPHHSAGFGDLRNYEIDAISWFERNSYDISYQTVVDSAVDPARLLRHKIIISGGHDEYWPQETMDAFEAAREAGVNLIFMGANAAYWRVRLGPAADGRPDRIVTCYKTADTGVADPSGFPTTRFRSIGQDEQALIGVHWGGYNYANAPYVPVNTGHWFWRGTNAVERQAIGVNILGYEMDHFSQTAPLPGGSGHTLLSSSPYLDGATGQTISSNSSIYQAASGAWVFASGSISWGWALGRPGYASPIVQKAMEQMIAIMLASAPTPAPPPLPPPSPSPFAPFDSADAFIRQQYLDLLGRPADSAGLSYWAGQVGADGSGRALVIDRFLASAEFMPRLQVARLYLAAFRRVPDPGGFDYWFDRNRAGLTLIPMARYFVGAPEFAARYGAVTDHVFVQLVYLNVFDRDPDPQGGAYWEDRLARGMDRGTLLAFFSESSEGITRYRARVDAIVTFEGLLQRPPATEEFGPWAQRLGAEPRTTLISDIVAGQEYAGRL